MRHRVASVAAVARHRIATNPIYGTRHGMKQHFRIPDAVSRLTGPALLAAYQPANSSQIHMARYGGEVDREHDARRRTFVVKIWI